MTNQNIPAGVSEDDIDAQFGDEPTVEEKEYRFKLEIVDENDEVVMSGSTFISPISEFGDCESVDEEVGKVMRYFNNEVLNK